MRRTRRGETAEGEFPGDRTLLFCSSLHRAVRRVAAWRSTPEVALSSMQKPQGGSSLHVPAGAHHLQLGFAPSSLQWNRGASLQDLGLGQLEPNRAPREKGRGGSKASSQTHHPGIHDTQGGPVHKQPQMWPGLDGSGSSDVGGEDEGKERWKVSGPTRLTLLPCPPKSTLSSIAASCLPQWWREGQLPRWRRGRSGGELPHSSSPGEGRAISGHPSGAAARGRSGWPNPSGCRAPCLRLRAVPGWVRGA